MWHGENHKRPGDHRADAPKEAGEPPVAEGDLLGNFVRRTDNDFRGVKDEGLIGRDIGNDDEETDEDDPQRVR